MEIRWSLLFAKRGNPLDFNLELPLQKKNKKTFVNVIQTCQFLRDQSVDGIARNCGCRSSLGASVLPTCQSLMRIFSNSPVPLPICFVCAVTSLKYLIGSTDQTGCQQWKSEARGEQGCWMRTSLFSLFKELQTFAPPKKRKRLFGLWDVYALLQSTSV